MWHSESVVPHILNLCFSCKCHFLLQLHYSHHKYNGNSSCMDPQPVWTLSKDKNVLHVIGNKLEFLISRNEKHCACQNIEFYLCKQRPILVKTNLSCTCQKRWKLMLPYDIWWAEFVYNFHYYRFAVPEVCLIQTHTCCVL
jgi:hypothetical protein